MVNASLDDSVVWKGAKAKESADVFSLAVLMAEMATGVVPFAHLENDAQVFVAFDRGERPMLPSPNASDIPACAVVELIKSAWAEDPSARPSAGDLYEAIVRAATIHETASSLNQDTLVSLYHFVSTIAFLNPLQLTTLPLFR